jgi:hypothetical protein
MQVGRLNLIRIPCCPGVQHCHHPSGVSEQIQHHKVDEYEPDWRR